MVSSEGLSDMDAMTIFNQIFSIFRVLHDHGLRLERETMGGEPVTWLWTLASERTGCGPEPEPGAVTIRVSQEVVP